MGIVTSYRVLHKFFVRLAEYTDIGRMSQSDALKLLGLTGTPSKEDIMKAYRQKAFENHPDRGGDPVMGTKLNVAKDILLGEGAYARYRPRPEPPPQREERKTPPVVDTIKGKSFSEGVHMPPGVKWLYCTKPEWVSYSKFGDDYRGWSANCWVAFGTSDTHLVFLGVKQRVENSTFDPVKGGIIKIDEDWDYKVWEVPLTKNLVTLAPKAAKVVCGAFIDGAVPYKVPNKYVKCPSELSAEAFKAIKFGSGGASLKDVLIASGLVSKEHPGVKGRKTNVEITPKYNLDLRRDLIKERGGKTPYAWECYDYFVSIDGGTGIKLEPSTVKNLEKAGFFYVVFKYDPNDKVTKNLTKMTGGHSTFTNGVHGGVVIKILHDALTHEPSSLKEALSEAVKEWDNVQK